MNTYASGLQHVWPVAMPQDAAPSASCWCRHHVASGTRDWNTRPSRTRVPWGPSRAPSHLPGKRSVSLSAACEHAAEPGSRVQAPMIPSRLNVIAASWSRKRDMAIPLRWPSIDRCLRCNNAVRQQVFKVSKGHCHADAYRLTSRYPQSPAAWRLPGRGCAACARS